MSPGDSLHVFKKRSDAGSMGSGDSIRPDASEDEAQQRGSRKFILHVVQDDGVDEEPRLLAVRGVRRKLGRLLRALPVVDWNASAFPDVVVSQLAQYDSVTAAYLWEHQRLDDQAVDDAIAGMRAIERWVRHSLSAKDCAVVRRQELQVRILDQELRDPLVLSEWSGAFVRCNPGASPASPCDDLLVAVAGLSAERLLVVARRLGVVSPVDWSRPGQERRAALEQGVLRVLRDPAPLSVLVSTLPDAARGLLAQLTGGCCDEGCLRRWAEFYIGQEPGSCEQPHAAAAASGHPVQLLRDCGLVFVDSACRLAVPIALIEPLRGALSALARLDTSACAAR